MQTIPDLRGHPPHFAAAWAAASTAVVALFLVMAGLTLEQAFGVLLVALALLDVFLTVLYARIGAGLISRVVARVTWEVWRRASRPFHAHRGVILSFCGPAILVTLVAAWTVTLTCGAGLIVHHALGSGVRETMGETRTDLVTAIYAGGSSIALVGSNDFAPRTTPFRLLYLFNSLVGISVISLTLTYLMQVYSALHVRNTLGMRVRLLAADTSDAAALLAGLAPKGDFGHGYETIAEIAGAITDVAESHHFYPVLFYFRFSEPYYSASCFGFMSLDAVSLIKCALSDELYGWLKESAAVEHLGRSSILLVTTLGQAFVPGGIPEVTDEPDPSVRDRWRRRYHAALHRLRRAGIVTVTDEEAGAEAYVSLRARWDGHVSALAPLMAYRMDEIDPVGSDPEAWDPAPHDGARGHVHATVRGS